ncbi:MAG: AMP-binding protein, partial [Candidatus Hydrogenedentes bacterium]|nr:AMP-binding protein [Candidatus Hydrogenedentota bacterium]
MDTFEQSNLTRAQMVFWLGQKLNPDTPLYHTAIGMVIPKAIDRVAFTAALQKIIDNSDVLRTVIEMKNGVPMQRALDPFSYSPEFLDFSQEADPVAAFRAWSDERCHQPFDFEKRLFDSALVKLADESYAWFFCQHHIICDMFSIVIMIQYLSMLYDAALEGTLDDAPPFPPFTAYLEQEFANRGALGDPAQRAYWEAKAATEPDPISFYGKPLPRLVGPAVRENVDLGEKLTRQIRELVSGGTVAAKSTPAAQFNIFAAILFAYLYRSCGVKQASIGMPFHNRRNDAWKQTLGIFMGVLPLGIEIDDNDTLHTLIGKVSGEAAANLRNSPYFIHNLLHTRAHDVLVNGLFAPYPLFGGVHCDLQWPLFRNVLDPLVLNFYENPLTGNFGNLFVFNTAIFSDEMQRLLIRDYDRMAHALLDNPDAAIRDIELLTDDDKRMLLVDWNATESPFPSDKTIHQLVEAQVDRTPDAVAVAFQDQRLTYHELNTRANQLAHYLRAQGVEHEVLVGLCVDRSPEMVIGLLGILKAGGAYVPLDPSYPAERLGFMLEDSKAHVLVTTDRLRRTLPVNGAKVVCMDRDWATIAKSIADNPVNGVGAGDLAYVIYTSGSSGKPKGALLEHRGVCNIVTHKAREFGLGPGTRMLQFCSLSFDPSVVEIFSTLTSGGTLWLLPQDDVKQPEKVVRTIKEARITNVM